MGVESLWKALEEAKCMEIIGAAELRKRYRRLAVDLSIWIMESLTSATLKKYHADAALHVVYARTLKLLKIGVCPVFVVEGRERRKITSAQNDGKNTATEKIRKRRNDAFWQACERCQEMLETLGVPVLQATVEGEALCALLNAKGKVDAVVSKDGDALLYGARVVISNFNIDHLERSILRCFHASKLRVVAPAEDEKDSDDVAEVIDARMRDDESQILPDMKRFVPSKIDPQIYICDKCFSFSRDDMISFALLTGSDLAASGCSNVGMKKALRFIRGCKRRAEGADRKKGAALQQMLDWSGGADEQEFSHQCSVCTHPGSCRDHTKNGCPLCENSSGEKCKEALPDEKFRQNLKKKLNTLSRDFLERTIGYYKNPNEAELPDSARMRMLQPNVDDMIAKGFKVNGRGKVQNQNFLETSLAKLLIRLHLICGSKLEKRAKTTFKYIPSRIRRQCTHRGHNCYEVVWSQECDYDNSTEGIQVATFEWCESIEKRYRDLCETFRREQRKEEQRQALKALEDAKRMLLPCAQDKKHSNKKEMSRPLKRQKRRKFREVPLFDGQEDTSERDVCEDALALLKHTSEEPQRYLETRKVAKPMGEISIPVNRKSDNFVAQVPILKSAPSTSDGEAQLQEQSMTMQSKINMFEGSSKQTAEQVPPEAFARDKRCQKEEVIFPPLERKKRSKFQEVPLNFDVLELGSKTDISGDVVNLLNHASQEPGLYGETIDVAKPMEEISFPVKRKQHQVVAQFPVLQSAPAADKLQISWQENLQEELFAVNQSDKTEFFSRKLAEQPRLAQVTCTKWANNGTPLAETPKENSCLPGKNMLQGMTGAKTEILMKDGRTRCIHEQIGICCIICTSSCSASACSATKACTGEEMLDAIGIFESRGMIPSNDGENV